MKHLWEQQTRLYKKQQQTEQKLVEKKRNIKGLRQNTTKDKVKRDTKLWNRKNSTGAAKGKAERPLAEDNKEDTAEGGDVNLQESVMGN